MTIIFTAEERAQYKANVIRASAKFSSFEILSQVEESVLYVCNTDMPDNWPSLIPDVTALIETGDEKSIFAGIACLRSFVRRFEFEKKDN